MNKDFSFLGLLHDNTARWMARHSELEHEIYYLTGKDLETLRSLFAAGWTLEPPKKNDSLLAEMAALAVEDDDHICGECVHYRWVEDYYDDGSYINVEYCDGDNYRPCSYDREACKYFCRDE